MLYESIGRRKSCRSYKGDPLPEARLGEMKEAIAGFDVLYPDVPLDYRIITETKGMLSVKAPHYLVVSGQGKAGEFENAGFVFEQLALWLDAQELGCVWLGKTQDVNRNPDGKDIVVIAFGETEGSPHREASGFKRKAIGDITNAPEDVRMQAVRLAPSGLNLQPWYFEKAGELFYVYEQKITPPQSLVYKLTDLDMGIALCHFALAGKRAGNGFVFRRGADLPKRKGYKPFGVIGAE